MGKKYEKVDFDLGKPRGKWEKQWILPMKTYKHTVDGRNAAPVDRW